MTLYSANVLDLATPVNAKKTSGGRKRKSDALAEKNDTAPEIATETVDLPPQPATKKVLSEKQVAALEKAKAARLRKKEEALALEQENAARLEKEAEEKVIAQRVLEEKKNALKEKRRLAREAKKALSTPPDTNSDAASVEDIIDEVVDKKKRDDVPPVWFKQYVAGVKKEEAKVSKEKKPQKQIAQEASQVAENQWNDGFTRDRVRSEVDNHMSRMYHMMFGGRRLK